MFWRHYFIVKLNCFILRITTVAGLGVPIFRVFTVSRNKEQGIANKAEKESHDFGGNRTWAVRSIIQCSTTEQKSLLSGPVVRDWI